MLRGNERRLHVGERLTDVFGGRYVSRSPVNRKPARLSGPVPPVGGYTGWWDCAQRESLHVVSSTLEVWEDLSGSGFHLCRGQNGGPAYGSRTINGILVPDFDGTAQYMSGKAPRDDRTSSTFVVAETDTVAAGVRTIIGSNGSGGLHFRTSADELQTSTSATLMAQLDNIVVASNPFEAAQIVSATDVTQYYEASSETDANATALTAGRTMEIAHNLTNNEYWNGAIAEIIYYPSTLSGGDVTLVLDYLRAKWNV